MKERVKCPRCGAEYDMLAEAVSKAIGGLCAACWCDWHENNIEEGREREIEGEQISNVDRKLVS
jgi:NMD protein affecting ribosome stability and mRNA decay